MATRTISNAGGNWSATTAWVEGVVPTQVDDVVATATSAALTVTAGAVCRSAIFTNYVAALTIPAGVTLSIGDTAGSQNAGNILTLAAGMTVTLGDNTAAISLVSTGAARQDVLTNGKSLGALSVVGVGCSIRLAGALTCTGLLTLTAGALFTNGLAVACLGLQSDNSNTRTLDITGSTVTIGVAGAIGVVMWAMTTTTGLTFVSTSSTVVVTVTTQNNNSFQVGGLTFNNVTFVGAALPNPGIGLAGSFTAAGTLAFNGNSVTNRMFVGSQTLLNTVAITANGTVTLAYTDLRDIAASGSASWNLAAATGGSGDCGGNTGITFTTSATQTWMLPNGGNWNSAASWSGRIPLPQDDISMACAFSSSKTVTAGMPRLGRSIDWTGCTGNPTFSISGSPVNRTLYGSMKFVAGVIASVSTLFFCESRGPATWTSAGVAWANNWYCQAPGGMTFQDAFVSTGRIYLTAGTLSANGFTITCSTLFSSGNIPRVLQMGTSSWTCSAASPLSFSGANLTVVCGTSTVACTIANATPGTFDTAGATFNIVTFPAGRTGIVTVSGNGTFNSLMLQPGNKLTFTSGTTTTVNALTASGVSGNLVTFAATVVGTPFTITSPNQISLDYVSLKDSAAVGAFFAGTHSTDVSGNTGWSFTAPGAFVPVRAYQASQLLGGL